MAGEKAFFEQQDCIKCGVLFGVPFGFTQNRKCDRGTFYCPNGHPMSYTESEADHLRRERDRLKQQIAERDDAVEREKRWRIEESEARAAAERRASAARGQVTKMKNRAAAGVCPCCSRTFQQLARHMADKHPDFRAEAGDAA